MREAKAVSSAEISSAKGFVIKMGNSSEYQTIVPGKRSGQAEFRRHGCAVNRHAANTMVSRFAVDLKVTIGFRHFRSLGCRVSQNSDLMSQNQNLESQSNTTASGREPRLRG